MISLIVARAHGGAIGKDGTIPWHAPEDLAFFQRETMGGAVIMGRRTWESLPFKPLKGRMNIVVTSQDTGAEYQFDSVAAAIAAAEAQGHRRIYGIGGAGIYRDMLGLAQRLLITEVALDVPGADAFFPEPTAGQWLRLGQMDVRAENPACVLVEYMRATPT